MIHDKTKDTEFASFSKVQMSKPNEILKAVFSHRALKNNALSNSQQVRPALAKC